MTTKITRSFDTAWYSTNLYGPVVEKPGGFLEHHYHSGESVDSEEDFRRDDPDLIRIIECPEFGMAVSATVGPSGDDDRRYIELCLSTTRSGHRVCTDSYAPNGENDRRDPELSLPSQMSEGALFVLLSALDALAEDERFADAARSHKALMQQEISNDFSDAPEEGRLLNYPGARDY